MQLTSDTQKQLAHFINFHSLPHSSLSNSIEGIVTTKNIQEDIIHIMKLLKKEFLIIEYSKYSNINTFLLSLSNALTQGKVIFITISSLFFNPIVFDQLNQIRKNNGFTVRLNDGEGEDLLQKQISPNAHIFILFQGEDNKKNQQAMYELADHVLDLQKEKII